ncbi:tRNA epoxyqueuosine(34) reductase QueG [Paracraurococcus ruber]|uniref:Epoxyqueuosine reductase n=1 Tax=Paracraurococcus ruber TaxID=77675 RepID=A0ABS1CV27_9PROT|nr:tRNA epoxyqueuosine(34) reductase QueG [Paracraurococcus ruber]MBK1658228.1 tRNA epoxyqueuosine(34) reductase QueG [Paracraurococcus ruber]TDG30597.1 tRNA epoxyqueuosine(34) reductase QueG [Paracraurococcus ruber]
MPEAPVPSPSAADAAARDAIRAEALRLGFDAVGFTQAVLPDAVRAGLDAFLAEGMHGTMGWLADRAAQRAQPRTLWPEAVSVIALGLNYGPDEDPLAVLARRDRGAISVYAQGKDYHDVVKSRLKALGRWMARRFAGTELKVFVDTAPVAEKPLAQQAGLGWQGKHTNLVSRGHGSWLFLGEIYTTLDLPPDPPEHDYCGSCHACLSVCPTEAFPAPYRLDARRCLSYLTIEHRGPIPEEFRAPMGNRIYGCDDCLAACPWNKFARAHAEPAFAPRATLRAPRLADLAALDDAAFRALFSGSPVKRIGRDRFVRNVLVAIGNSGDPALRPVAQARAEDADPVVAEAARWAALRLEDRSREAGA